jgi:CHAD domain-containing protein
MTGRSVAEPSPLDSVRAVLTAEFRVRDGASATVARTYLDTFDARLRSRGLCLQHERGRLELLERAAEIPVAVAGAGDLRAPLRLAQLPPGELRAALSPIVQDRALLPLARVSCVQRSLALLDELDKTVVRLILEAPMLADAGGSGGALRTRVRLIPLRGYERERARAGELLAAVGLGCDPEPLRDEAVRAGGGDPGGISAKVSVELRAGERADTAVVRVLFALNGVIEANLPGALADIDPEFLHDLRVSVRRTRSVQREFRGVFPAPELAELRAEFRWLQRVTGPSRDLDVHLGALEQTLELVPARWREDLRPIGELLEQRRASAHRAMSEELRSPRAVALLERWELLLGNLVASPQSNRPDAATPIEALSARRIRRVHRRMVRMGRAIGEQRGAAPPEAYHELRKQGKELRYLLELFGPLHDPEVVSPMIRSLKSLQDVLGHHQDREVQLALLPELAAELVGRQRSARTLMALGVLAEALEDDAARSRGAFEGVFSGFASGSARRAIEREFGS